MLREFKNCKKVVPVEHVFLSVYLDGTELLYYITNWYYLSIIYLVWADIHYSNIGGVGGVTNPKWSLISKRPVCMVWFYLYSP